VRAARADGFEEAQKRLDPVISCLRDNHQGIGEVLSHIEIIRRASPPESAKLAPGARAARAEAEAVARDQRAHEAKVHARPKVARAFDGTKNNGLKKPERLILAVLAQRNPRASSRSQMSILSGYSIKSSSFANALSKLRSLELIGRGEIKASEEFFR